MSLTDSPRDDVIDVQPRPLQEAGDAARAATPDQDHAQPVPLEPLSGGDGPPPAGAVRPNLRFMCAHLAHVVAFGFGSGLSPVAPGTAGTLWAWLAWALLAHWLTPVQLGWLLAASLPVAWWASTVTANHLRVADPSAVVIDEIVAFWAVLWLLLPAGFWTQAAAFLLFRVFDAVKRGPVGWADRLMHGQGGWRGGFGIVLDDLVAAFCTLLVIALWRAW
ncbi:MAG: phosphatidylglycerophosphatase A [Desulfovibrionaceae bacterium]|nr:phosphatidylglycerophosphatase A [Desulfovibrionaceae bacterium]